MKLRVLKGKTTEEHVRSADQAIHYLIGRIAATQRFESLTPFLLSCYIEKGSQVLTYIPIRCRFEFFDISVDEIEVGEKEKPAAIATVKMDTLNEGIHIFQLPIKLGHFVKRIDKEVISPVKVTISFDKPISAWLCLVAYPTVGKIIPVEEVPDEGIQLSLLEPTEGNQS